MPKFDFQSQFSMLKGRNLSNFVPPFENSTTRIAIVYILKITNTSGPSYYFPPSIVYCIMINKIRMYTYSELTTEI